eukprot:TRINITY_DN1397_c0_g1_i4.p1 TRINITY_DN1397_c0_g1~~TRINITY_DN1397_c0_g1_i4.p1  ORF type:complete len:500 (-),score=22.86 TRINITY_DN1397_c0_g1_i4:97-1596(-)
MASTLGVPGQMEYSWPSSQPTAAAPPRAPLQPPPQIPKVLPQPLPSLPPQSVTQHCVPSPWPPLLPSPWSPSLELSQFPPSLELAAPCAVYELPEHWRQYRICVAAQPLPRPPAPELRAELPPLSPALAPVALWPAAAAAPPLGFQQGAAGRCDPGGDRDPEVMEWKTLLGHRRRDKDLRVALAILMPDEPPVFMALGVANVIPAVRRLDPGRFLFVCDGFVSQVRGHRSFKLFGKVPVDTAAWDLAMRPYFELAPLKHVVRVYAMRDMHFLEEARAGMSLRQQGLFVDMRHAQQSVSAVRDVWDWGQHREIVNTQHDWSSQLRNRFISVRHTPERIVPSGDQAGGGVATAGPYKAKIGDHFPHELTTRAPPSIAILTAEALESLSHLKDRPRQRRGSGELWPGEAQEQQMLWLEDQRREQDSDGRIAGITDMWPWERQNDQDAHQQQQQRNHLPSTAFKEQEVVGHVNPLSTSPLLSQSFTVRPVEAESADQAKAGGT